MEIGDKVTWTSQAGSTTRTKIGEVIEVVPKNHHPQMKKSDNGMPRNHESYVVRAYAVFKGRSGQKSYRLYWPRVSKLKPYKEPS